VQEENIPEKNTHIGICHQELAKGARQQKEEKDIYILLAPT
jgi:hypothetical protein